MPNLSLTHIAASLAALGSAAFISSCTKQADVSREPAKATEVPTATVAASTAPSPVAATATQERERDDKAAVDSSVPLRKAAGPGGATSGQMSCGAGKCSGEVTGKKK